MKGRHYDVTRIIRKMSGELKGDGDVGDADIEMKIGENITVKEEPSSASKGPRFEIKKWNAVTMWSWDICADTCAICRNSLNEPSIEYQVWNMPIVEF